MKKVLLFLLLFSSISGFAQKYKLVIEANDRVWVTTPEGEQKSVTRSPQIIALLKNQAIAINGVTDNNPITLLNFDFALSNIPTQSTIQGLFNYLKLNTFIGIANSTKTFSDTAPIPSTDITTNGVVLDLTDAFYLIIRNKGTTNISITYGSTNKTQVLSPGDVWEDESKVSPVTNKSSKLKPHTINASGGIAEYEIYKSN